MLANVTPFSTLKSTYLANVGAEFAEKVPECPATAQANGTASL